MALKRATSNYFVLDSDQKRSNRDGDLERAPNSLRDRLGLMDILGDSSYYIMGDNVNDPDVVHTGHDQSGADLMGDFDDEKSIDYCCEVLYRKFGFQIGSIDNQREHALLLLANAKSRERVNGGVDHVSLLHRKLVGNYVEWCQFLKADPMWYAGELNNRLTNRLHMELMLYLCIWGEAANVRHMPECICYLYHQLMGLLNADLFGTRPFPERWYLDSVIRPIWTQCAGMQKKDEMGKHLEHTKVRNYDDFNEFFWRDDCLAVPADQVGDVLKSHGKTYYEHRSILTLVLNYYRIFHFNFMFLFILSVLQYCVTISPNGASSGFSQFGALGQAVSPYTTLDLKMALVFLVLAHGVLSLIKGLLELAQTWHLLTTKTESRPKSTFTYGSALCIRLFWNGAFSVIFLLMMMEGTTAATHPWLDRFIFLGPVFVGPGLITLLVTAISPPVVRTSFWAKFIREGDTCYVGRNMTPPWSYRVKYISFWLVLWFCKACVSYWVLITPLMLPSLAIYNMSLTYTTNVVSVRNVGVIFSLWAPVFFVFCYDTQIYFTIFQALYGAFKGIRMHTGEYHGFHDISKAFRLIPQRFDCKVVTTAAVSQDHIPSEDGHRRSMLMARFVVVWNEVINFFREGDLLDDKEAAILQYDIAPHTGEIYEPVFLSAGKVQEAIASVLKIERRKGAGRDAELSVELLLHDCNSALKSCFNAVLFVLESMLDTRDASILEAFDLIEQIAAQNKFMQTLQTQHIVHVRDSLVEFLEAVLDLPAPTTPHPHAQTTKAHPMPVVQEFVKRFGAFLHAVTMLCGGQPIVVEKLSSSHFCSTANGYMAAAEGLVNLSSSEVAMANATRALLLLTLDTSEAMPRCSEAKRRLGFFMKTLMMDIPQLNAVKEMRSFSVMTPFYAEGVLYSLEELNAPLENHPIFSAVEEQGKNLTILKYLITIHTEEWENFIERIGVTTEEEARREHPLELRLWASYRGQTLARTVQGMMLYEDAIKMLYWLEIGSLHDKTAEVKQQLLEDMVVLKFSYICACQVYGKHKAEGKAQAVDIDYLLKVYPNLRVAFVDTAQKDGKNVYSSVLIKWEKDDIAEVYRYELPGDPILGEGKPENQNNAIPFTRGEFLQTIDMNQQHYFEECLKMPNLLVTADQHPSGKPVSIIGMREHIFTGNASSLSKFKSWQELVFVTLSQRVLADPLYVRMHYGHPDVFDKVMCLTRGGVSKSSKGINLSEDVFAGFNSTLRGGVVTHVEFMQCGKGRDVALSQISMFEGKLANGAGETSLAREAHRMGAFMDFFRLNSMYYSHTGFYFATWLTIVTAYIFMYSKVYLALTGIQDQIVFKMSTTPIVWNNQDKGFTTRAYNNLNNIVNTQYYIQAGLFLTLPLIAVYFTEAGLRRGLLRFINMMLTCGWAFFTFQVGTTTHYFDLNIVHGQAKYQATGRGFKITRETFVLLYKAYSGSHYRKAMELIGLCLIYGSYGNFQICQKTVTDPTNSLGAQFCGTAQSYGVQTFAIWFISVLWLLSPFLFNSDGFDYEKTKVDILAWAKWMYMTKDDKDDDKVNQGGWIGWWQGEVDQYNGSKAISRITVFLRECRHFIVAWYVVTLRHPVIDLLYTSLAVLATLGVFQSFSCFNGLGTSPIIRAAVYFFVFAIALSLYLVMTLVIWGSKNTLDSFSLLYGYFAILYGINEMARVWAFPTWSISKIGLFQQLAFFFDFMFGVIMLVPLMVLSVIPFMNIIQTRMMYNEGFSQVMSDSSQYAFSIAGMVGFAGAGACGWAYYVLTTLDFSGSFLAYTSLYQVELSPLGNSAYYTVYGAVVGSLISSVVGYYFGRRATIFTGGFASFVAMTLLSGSSTFGGRIFLPSLCLFGAAIGILLPAITLYCYEISTKDMRPKIMLVLALGFILGSLIATWCTHGGSLVWMWQLFWCFLILALLAPAINLLPESPYWVLARHGPEEAEAALILLRRRTDVTDELNMMKESQAYKVKTGASVYKALAGFGIVVVLSLSLLPLNIYVARVNLGYGHALMLTNCLAVELLFAVFSFVYIDKFAHKLILIGTLLFVAILTSFVAGQDHFQIFANDQTPLGIIFIILYAIKGMGFPATLWVGFVGMFRTRGRFVSMPIYFTTFFAIHLLSTYIRLESPNTRSATSKEYTWLFALVACCVVILFSMFGLGKRMNGMLCTVQEMEHDRKVDDMMRQRAPSHGGPRRRAYTNRSGSRRFTNQTLSPKGRSRVNSRKGSDAEHTPYQSIQEVASV
ncbi:Aste57867_18239 [Aphanomyces stellatus]|uniref:1,3-beta-glucan synthase n=1 Tax=Aphanomyces stellatus TaxID=120398 RepID=A0A485LA70_9STRA|nr:hypothetical protein As57867_018177 [Aphanomyces stellatus]VFT94977.1 Aste57867_18239 [Aphanomyces stellatus]